MALKIGAAEHPHLRDRAQSTTLLTGCRTPPPAPPKSISTEQARYLESRQRMLERFGQSGFELVVDAMTGQEFLAVAVNENRYLFPGESIGRGTQRGFVGSHADIGGSYATGDLSDVALNWIVEQARASGLTMKTWLRIDRDEWGIVTDPVVHDKSIGEEESAFCLRINNERWADQCTSRRSANPGGLNAAQVTAEEFIIARSPPGMDADGESKIVGDVNMEAYAQWLQENYSFVISAEP